MSLETNVSNVFQMVSAKNLVMSSGTKITFFLPLKITKLLHLRIESNLFGSPMRCKVIYNFSILVYLVRYH